MRNLENERDSLRNECDQERIAYQKLLKAYNKLEAQFENAQDELNALKNPGAGQDLTYDSMSFASMDDSSAYGSKAASEVTEIDIGLTMRLQHKLKVRSFLHKMTNLFHGTTNLIHKTSNLLHKTTNLFHKTTTSLHKTTNLLN